MKSGKKVHQMLVPSNTSSLQCEAPKSSNFSGTCLRTSSRDSQSCGPRVRPRKVKLAERGLLRSRVCTQVKPNQVKGMESKETYKTNTFNCSIIFSMGSVTFFLHEPI